MRKGFTRKPQRDAPATPGKNYMKSAGLQRLKDENPFLLTRERRSATEWWRGLRATGIVVKTPTISLDPIQASKVRRKQDDSDRIGTQDQA